MGGIFFTHQKEQTLFPLSASVPEALHIYPHPREVRKRSEGYCSSTTKVQTFFALSASVSGRLYTYPLPKKVRKGSLGSRLPPKKYKLCLPFLHLFLEDHAVLHQHPPRILRQDNLPCLGSQCQIFVTNPGELVCLQRTR